MNVDQILLDLKRDEGVRSKPYDDHTGKDLRPGDTIQGNITIGIGCNISAGIPDSAMEFLARMKIEDAMLALDRHVPGWRGLSEARQNALVNMAYNLMDKIGQFVKMIAAFVRTDFSSAADEIRNSAWASQVGESRTKHVSDAIENG